MKTAILVMAFLASLVAASVNAADDDEAAWDLLKSRGQVVLMRHATTPPGVGDPPGMKIDDCSTQRNLSDEGRAQARRIAEAWLAHGAQPGRVLSSPMCRCLETARLAFGRVDEQMAVTNARVESEMPRQVREIRVVAGTRHRGAPIVIVSHGTTIAALTGITPQPGEMLILTPEGDGRFEIRARLAIKPPAP